MIFTIILILLCITGFSLYRAYKVSKEVKTINKEIDEENEKLQNEHH